MPVFHPPGLPSFWSWDTRITLGALQPHNVGAATLTTLFVAPHVDVPRSIMWIDPLLSHYHHRFRFLACSRLRCLSTSWKYTSASPVRLDHSSRSVKHTPLSGRIRLQKLGESLGPSSATFLSFALEAPFQRPLARSLSLAVWATPMEHSISTQQHPVKLFIVELLINPDHRAFSEPRRFSQPLERATARTCTPHGTTVCNPCDAPTAWPW